jgi:hypothetical protein
VWAVGGAVVEAGSGALAGSGQALRALRAGGWATHDTVKWFTVLPGLRFLGTAPIPEDPVTQTPQVYLNPCPTLLPPWDYTGSPPLGPMLIICNMLTIVLTIATSFIMTFGSALGLVPSQVKNNTCEKF